MAHVRQSRPDYGLGFQVRVLKTFQAVPLSLGRRPDRIADSVPAAGGA